MLTRDRILSLLAELNDELCRMGVRGDIFIVGGAAMVVAYDARPVTRDVDGIWHPSARSAPPPGGSPPAMTSSPPTG